MGAARALIEAEAKNKAPYSYQRVLEHRYVTCQSAVSETDDYQRLSTIDDRRHLMRWVEVAPSRAGMEKWAIRAVAKDRSVRRYELTDMVLQLQDHGDVCPLLQQQTLLQQQQALDQQQRVDRTEAIRRACERISRPSRLFAVAMAQAHAAVLQKEAHLSSTELALVVAVAAASQ
jgi:hypothetical protein